MKLKPAARVTNKWITYGGVYQVPTVELNAAGEPVIGERDVFVPMYITWRERSKYKAHQGLRERARRVGKMSHVVDTETGKVMRPCGQNAISLGKFVIEQGLA